MRWVAWVRKGGGRLGRWVWGHKIRSLGVGVLLLTVVYACVFAVVSLKRSPTDLHVELENGRTVAYMTREGTRPGGRRLVLVHGAPADASSWNLFLRRELDGLALGEVVVVDRLGYGNSTPGRELSLAAHAAALEPFLDAVDGAKPILVGHSYGGPVVLRAAAEYPDSVGGVILVAGATNPYMKDSKWFRGAVNAVSGVVPEPWAVSNAELLALTDENLAMEGMLGRIVCPVLVIHGTWDPVCPCDGTVEYLRSRLTGTDDIRTRLLKRTGHNIHLSSPDVIAEEIRSMCARLDRSAAE